MATAHATAFAGIFGSSTGTTRSVDECDVSAVTLPQGSMLLDPAGSWAVRLEALDARVAQALFLLVRDLGTASTQNDQAALRRVQAYDTAAYADATFAEEIDMGIAALEALALKVTRRHYREIRERALRRTLLMQLTDLPLLRRLRSTPLS